MGVGTGGHFRVLVQMWIFKSYDRRSTPKVASHPPEHDTTLPDAGVAAWRVRSAHLSIEISNVAGRLLVSLVLRWGRSHLSSSPSECACNPDAKMDFLSSVPVQ